MILIAALACDRAVPPLREPDDRFGRASDSAAPTDPVPGWCDWTGTVFLEIDGTFDAALDACLGSDPLEQACADRYFEAGAASACPDFVEYLTQIGWLDPYVARDAYVARCVTPEGSPVDRVASVWFAPTGEMVGFQDFAFAPAPESGEAGSCFVCDGRVTTAAWWGPPVEAVCSGDGTRQYSPQDFGAPSSEVDCGNTADDDFDQVRDCFDSDCAGAPECACGTPELVLGEPPLRMTGTTAREPSCHEPPGDCVNGGSRASDASFVYEAPWTGDYVFDTIGTEWDTVLYAVDTRSLEPIACNDWFEFGTDDCAPPLTICAEPGSRIEVELEAGQHVELVVDGRDSGGGGPFVLNASSERPPGPSALGPGESDGCGCGAPPVGSWPWLVLVAVALTTRRPPPRAGAVRVDRRPPATRRFPRAGAVTTPAGRGDHGSCPTRPSVVVDPVSRVPAVTYAPARACAWLGSG